MFQTTRLRQNSRLQRFTSSRAAGLVPGKPLYPATLDAANSINNSEGAMFIFDEATGTTVNDLTASGNGTMGSGCTWSTGLDGPLASFDGTTSCGITVPDSAGWNPSNLFTVFGVLTTGSSVTGQKVVAGRWDSPYQWLLDILNGNFRVIFNGGGTILLNATTVTINTRYSYAFVYDGAGSVLDFYLNGVLNNGTLTGGVPSSLSGGALNSQHPRIGIKPDLGGPYIGTMDCLRVWTRALSSSEITQLNVTPYMGSY